MARAATSTRRAAGHPHRSDQARRRRRLVALLLVHVGVRKRMSDGFQFQAHYTWSRDKDTDTNERSATGLTMTNGAILASTTGSPSATSAPFRRQRRGRAAVEFQLSGILTLQSGPPFTAHGCAASAKPTRTTRASTAAIVPRSTDVSSRATASATRPSRTSTCVCQVLRVSDARIRADARGVQPVRRQELHLGTGASSARRNLHPERDGTTNPEFVIQDGRWPLAAVPAGRSRIDF